MSTKIGKRIKQIRQSMGISQTELARRIKYLNQSQVSKIEKGDRKATVQDLVEIAKALGVSTDEIIDDSGGRSKRQGVG